ncbi:DUF1491 family protein [Acetobacter sp. TBRC 12305]|uniref:DUF1491 family protein n=1 Tax=Acetobacter garciniae TaxID=2817435 RepID=A0A939HLD8_9PROT|nr:DUF1491 family protein [Acetobacter garciniae]MBO1323759.1 DUF1491 family protein [Acetobacter garciniae]MBX0343448.1 DUF1491 family protein [Acetobacter garciniae]
MAPPPRLRSDLIARAIIRQSAMDGRMAVIARKGDADAGSILVVLNGRGGQGVVLSQTRTQDGENAWLRATGPDPVGESEVQDYVARQLRYDPDLWVLEIDAADFSPPFQAILL